MIDAKKILNMQLVDSTGQNVGKVKTIEINGNTGKAEFIEIKLDKGIFSRETEKVRYEYVDNVHDVILLKVKIEMDK